MCPEIQQFSKTQQLSITKRDWGENTKHNCRLNGAFQGMYGNTY